MHKFKFGLLIVSTLALVAGAVSFSPSKEPIDDCLIDPEDRHLATATYALDPKNEPWYKYSQKYHSLVSGAVSTDYQFNQQTTVFERINIGDTWDTNRGENVRVAVIDTGIYKDHQDFSVTNISNLSKNTYYNTTDISDGSGHGTTSAAMIAAAVNGVGGTGVAPNVELVVLNAATPTGTFSLNSINNALQYCIDNDVDVINMSLQGYTSSFTSSYFEDFGEYNTTVSSTGTAGSSDYSAKINACYEAGITVVAAAGNYNTDRVSYPAANDHVIAVASTGLTDANGLNKAGFSNYGSWVDVCAPGYVYTPKTDGTNSYSVSLGTSFSAPIVTGAIALYKSRYPDATPDEIEEALKATCTPVDWEGGAGQINISSFLNYEPGEYVPVTGISFDQKNYYVDKDSGGYLSEFSYTITPSNATNKNVTFSSSDDNNFPIDDSEWVSGPEDKIVALTVTCEDNSNISDTCNITIGEDYYKGITASDSADLSAQLHNLMFDTHTTYKSYDDCRDTNGEYYAMDPGSSNSYLTDFYTRHDISKAWSGNASGTWNREHIWCQSKSAGLWNDTKGSTKGGGADYHHIRPIEHDLNSTRNNNTYGLVSHKNSDTEKYSKTSSGTNAYLGGYLENGVWEPLDSVKGDIARILMYVWVHYSSDAGGTTPTNYASYVGKLQLNDIICEGTSVSASKAMLLNWHNQDPVDNSERIRNEAAYGYQGNRNPFIDHPEYASIIFASDVVHVTSVTLNTDSLTLLPSETSTLTATVLPVDANNRNITWSTSDPSVVTISNGTVTAVAPGTATITVSTVDGNKTATCSITVNKIAVTSISIKSETSIVCGKYETLGVSVFPINASEKGVTWSTADSLIATVDSAGKVTGVSVGTTTITATSKDNSSITSSCTVHITPIVVTGITINQGDKTLDIGGTYTYTATVTPTNATNKAVEWNSSNASVATIDQNGKVTALAVGTTNITASATDGSGIISTAKVITVAAKLVSISFVNLPTELDFGSYGGLYHVQVQKNFSDGTHTIIEEGLGTTSILTVDTTTLGNKVVKAVFNGATTITDTVRVTNKGSSQQSHEVEGGTVTTTITNKTFYGNGNTVISGETFVLESDTEYFNYADRGQQIGSSGDPITKATITKRNQMRVTKVVINASGGSKTNAIIKVKVGGVYFSYNSAASASIAQASGADAGTTSASLTSTAANYEFTGDSIGDIAIEYEQSSSTAIFFKSLEVKTETTTIDSFTGVEQAEAWANYFIDKTRGSNGPCLKSDKSQKIAGLQDLWGDFAFEYENMTDDGKNAFCDPTTSSLIRECLIHYQFIVKSYGIEGSLTDFVENSEHEAPAIVNSAHGIVKQVFNESTIAIVIIVFIGIAAIGAFVIYKKRKEN